MPDRYLSFPGFALDAPQWDELQIPVGLAFFFPNSALGRTVAFYPGPAGATESELPLGAWDAIVAANPALGTARARRRGAARPDAGRRRRRDSRHLVPIDPATSWSGALRRPGAGSTAARRPGRCSTSSSPTWPSRSRPAPAVATAMTELSFTVVDVVPEPYAAAPNLLARLRVEEPPARPCTRWRCAARSGSSRSAAATTTPRSSGLLDLFGEPRPRFGQTLRPFPWLHASTVARGSPATTEVDLPLPCTYDFEVAGAKYLHALRDGEVPLLFLFSGTVFTRGDDGFRVEQVPWHREARLPACRSRSGGT